MKLVLPKAVDVRRLIRTDGRQDLVGYFLTLRLQSIDCLCHRNDVVEGENICKQVIVLNELALFIRSSRTFSAITFAAKRDPEIHCTNSLIRSLLFVAA